MMNVVIVDDDEIKAEKIRDCILSTGINVNINIFLNMAESTKYLLKNELIDFLILDLHLPVRPGESPKPNSGKKFLSQIIKNKNLSRPHHIIGLTSFQDLAKEFHNDFFVEGWLLVEYVNNSDVWQDTVRNKVMYIDSNKSMEKLKVLFFASSPVTENALYLGRESRFMKEVIDSSSRRDSIEFLQTHATKLTTFTGELIKFKPNILHFSGHGAETGIVLERDNGDSHLIPNAALEKLFKTVPNLNCLILNACYSASLAKSISSNGYYVVGMSDSISDNAAIAFSQGFYQSIMEGQSVEDSFNIGVVCLIAEEPDEEFVPQLWYDGLKI